MCTCRLWTGQLESCMRAHHSGMSRASSARPADLIVQQMPACRDMKYPDCIVTTDWPDVWACMADFESGRIPLIRRSGFCMTFAAATHPSKPCRSDGNFAAETRRRTETKLPSYAPQTRCTRRQHMTTLLGRLCIPPSCARTVLPSLRRPLPLLFSCCRLSQGRSSFSQHRTNGPTAPQPMSRTLDAPNLLIGSLSALQPGAGFIPRHQQQIHTLRIKCAWHHILSCFWQILIQLDNLVS